MKFIKKPAIENAVASFTVRNSYEADGNPICTEDCEIRVTFESNGTMLIWTSIFQPAGKRFYFGDQEEMGLGVRVATPLAVVKGGSIRDSEERKDEAQVWGKQADWCEYTGMLEGRRVGVVLMPNPKNFRRSWFHARNYGLLLANPFGRNAFTKGEKSRIVVKAGKEFQLRFGVLLYDADPDKPSNIATAYRDFTKQLNPPKD